LLEDEINNARELAPHLHFEVAGARQLPFEDGTMDLVLAFTLFSAIQSPSIREDVAEEMLRVLKPVRCSARARLLDDRSGQPGQLAATTHGD
jgi:ubiquinone/menaquinone biosynthesis C-methylase UbiE